MVINWMRNLLILAALLLGLVFAFFNLAMVRVDYLFGESEASLVLVLACALLAGYALGLVSLLPRWLRTRTELAASRRRAAEVEAELKNLR
ncbi:MAG: LapA family protein, partial [Acidobacteria bacterium]|nr:LapA family protein [Acidobacteriota bacterium]